jgi:hypothetical protein
MADSPHPAQLRQAQNQIQMATALGILFAHFYAGQVLKSINNAWPGNGCGCGKRQLI